MSLSTEEAKTRLRTHINNKDLEGYRKDFADYLSKYPNEFKLANGNEPSIPSYNYVIGDPNLPRDEHPVNFRLKTTTSQGINEILKKGEAAQKIFAKLSLGQRLEFIKVLKEKMDLHKEDIAFAISADTGKPISYARKELVKANEWLDYALTDAPKQLQTPEGEKPRDLSPHGIVEVIASGNYPVALGKGPAVGGIVTGNSIVFAIPEKALNTAGPMMEPWKEAVHDFAGDKKYGFSDAEKKILEEGLVQHTIGRNDLYLKADFVNFVGSNQIGEKIKKERGDKPTIVEMGGNNVVVVMNSAVTKGGKDSEDKWDENAKEIAKQLYESFGPLAGQRCTSMRNLITQKGPAEKVTGHLIKLIENPVIGKGGVGNPLEEGTTIGALIDDQAYKDIKSGHAIAADVKAEFIGTFDANHDSAENGLPKGSPHYVNPVMIDFRNVDIDFSKPYKAPKDILEQINADKNTKALGFIAGGEKFGPMVNIIKPQETLEDIIQVANVIDHTHKLAGAVFTADPEEVKIYQKATRVNSVVHGGQPKDPSPKGKHGTIDDPGVGGDHHFLNFTKHFHVLYPPRELNGVENKPMTQTQEPALVSQVLVGIGRG